MQNQTDLDRLRALLTTSLENRAREEILAAIANVLGDGDLMFLSGLGIDGRQKMLDIFIEQCRLLSKEP